MLEAHKAMSTDCPSRESFNKIRQRAQPSRISKNTQNYNSKSNHPNTLNQHEMPDSSNMRYSQHFNLNTNNDNLFSFEELKKLTFELISNLRKCNSELNSWRL